MASSLDPVEPPKFDASLLVDLPFRILLDLLTLSGLLNAEEDSSLDNHGTGLETSLSDSGKSLNADSDEMGHEMWMSGECFVAKHSIIQAEDVDAPIEETQYQSKNKGNDSDGGTESSTLFHSTCSVRRQGNSERSQAACLQDSVASIKSSRPPDIASIVEPVLKVCALKSLTVLLGSNTLLETLSIDVYTKNSALSEEISQQGLNYMQTLLRSMVSYTVLPSPFRRVVTLMDLERTQSVLIRAVPSVYFNKKIAVERKAFTEGMFVRVQRRTFSFLM